jgi:hypothetical protein
MFSTIKKINMWARIFHTFSCIIAKQISTATLLATCDLYKLGT